LFACLFDKTDLLVPNPLLFTTSSSAVKTIIKKKPLIKCREHRHEENNSIVSHYTLLTDHAKKLESII
jgi:hypothetical protein